MTGPVLAAGQEAEVKTALDRELEQTGRRLPPEFVAPRKDVNRWTRA